MERPRCRAVKLSIPPSTRLKRSSVMGMALFAREGGLNSALPALSRSFRSPDPKVHRSTNSIQARAYTAHCVLASCRSNSPICCIALNCSSRSIAFVW
jgi:hypothetical protein